MAEILLLLSHRIFNYSRNSSWLSLSLDWLSLFANLKMLKTIHWDVEWEDIDQDPAFPHLRTYCFADSTPVKRIIESTFKIDIQTWTRCRVSMSPSAVVDRVLGKTVRIVIVILIVAMMTLFINLKSESMYHKLNMLSRWRKWVKLRHRRLHL